ncbi:hypothetical protein BDZ45DRAFT_681237 [Acephala macrosclerotiorum]|nr:hypothetical protein BDZ45DRAFT_681237 [Acephala macrosclerotiorum]
MAAQKTIIVISSDSESASDSPAPPAPQPEYVELPDEPEDLEGVFGKLWDHHYKSLRRIYMHAQMVKRTGTDTLKQNATVYLAHMVQLERVRVQLNKALNAYSKASTSAEILERWRELRRLNDEYTAAIEAQDPRNWIIPRYRRLYSTHIQQWCYSTLMCHTMEWMVTDAASTYTNDKYILDIMGLKETTQRKLLEASLR